MVECGAPPWPGHLAGLYNVSVKRLNEQAKGNRKRFPADFMFQLTPRENKSLRSQFATSKIGRGGRRSLPYAFTEHGAIMAATVLNSEQAVDNECFCGARLGPFTSDAGCKQ